MVKKYATDNRHRGTDEDHMFCGTRATPVHICEGMQACVATVAAPTRNRGPLTWGQPLLAGDEAERGEWPRPPRMAVPTEVADFRRGRTGRRSTVTPAEAHRCTTAHAFAICRAAPMSATTPCTAQQRCCGSHSDCSIRRR